MSKAHVAPHEWLFGAVLVGTTNHYFWLMDDAFVYFRYVDNLLFLDRGLVYNPGEYVEGFSSPLWLLALVSLRALGLDIHTIVRVLACGCAAIFAALLVRLNRSLSPPGPVVNFPLATAAAHYGVTTHFSSGLETPLVQLYAPLFALLVVRPESVALQALVGLSPLVRSEFALAASLVAVWSFVRLRRVPWTLVAVLVGANGSWLVFRIHYYADLLPNTFYLKDGSHVRQGLYYMQNAARGHHAVWALAALVGCAALGGLFARGRHREPWPRAAMLAVAAAYAAYVVRIGGDMLYFRYAAFPIGLAMCAGAGLVEAALVRAGPRRTWASPAAALAVALAFGASVPDTLRSHPWTLEARSRKWHDIADPMWHRRHPSLRDLGRGDDDARRLEAYRQARLSGRERAGTRLPVIATGSCAQGYREFDKYVVHSYGLTDAVLARVPAEFGRPGHKFVQAHAEQLRRLHTQDPHGPGRGMLDRWLLHKSTRRWLRRNATALRLVERKIYNRHDFAENLALAFTRVDLR